MIFSYKVKHDQDIVESITEGKGRMILGENEGSERDKNIKDIKNKKFK